MKKILFIPGIVQETIGGAELQAGYIAADLQKKGHEIFGIHVHPNEFARPKYKCLHLQINRLSQKLNAQSFYAHKIYNFIKQIKPDIIYSRAFMPSLAPAVYYSKKFHCKSIWHISHNQLVEKYRCNSLKHLPFQLIDKMLLHYSIRHVNYIISQTDYQNQLLEKNHHRKVNLVVPNFHPRPQEEIKKKKQIQIVWVANFKKWKQPEQFIQLAGELKQYPDIKCIMVGRSAKDAWMEKITREIGKMPNLVWKGSLPIDHVNKLLAESHIFVNTSLYEGFPNTFIQAWMRKVPVLSLHVDIDGILVKEKIGFISHNFENLLQKTKFLINNPFLLNKMGSEAQKHAYRNYSIEANIGKVTQIFE